MKIKLLVLTFLTFIGGVSFAEVSNNNWSLITFTNEEFMTFKPQEIVTNGRYKQTWIRTNSFKNKTYERTFVKADCLDRTLIMGTKVDYDSKGNFVKTTNLGSKVLEVPPESVGGKILESICTDKGFIELNRK